MWVGVLLGGCSLAIDTTEVRPKQSEGELPDPAIFQAAELFAGVELDGNPLVGLLEGAGTRFESTEAVATNEPIPLYLAQLAVGDEVMVTIPSEFSSSWTICGQSVMPGKSIRLEALERPCLRGDTAMGLTLAIPVDESIGQGDTIGPLIIEVKGAERSDTIEVPVVALDEIAGTPLRNDGVYSRVVIEEAYVPLKTTSAIAWKSVSDMDIVAPVDASGSDGEGDVSCSRNGGCGGGFAGPGSPGGGSGNGASSSSTCSASSCDAPSTRGGAGGTECTLSDCNGGPTIGSGGGGGGNATTGKEGKVGTLGCGGRGLGGAGDESVRMLVSIDEAWGGGGGAGTTMEVAGGGPTYDGSGGGGGGGLIDLMALGNMRIDEPARLLARGGAGGGPETDTTLCNMNKTVSRGGGGAGGAIRIRAGTVFNLEVLGNVIDIRGGYGGLDGAEGEGEGGRGRARIDGPGADEGGIAGIVRGAHFDPISTITAEATISVLVNGNDAISDGLVSYAYRAFGADQYQLAAEPSAGGAVSLLIPLEPGLNEVCALATPQQDAGLDAIPEGAKRCTWIAYVEGATL